MKIPASLRYLGKRLRRLRSAPQAYANLYDICAPLLGSEPAPHAPGRQLRKLARRVLEQPALKWFILKGCRHPGLPLAQAEPFRAMLTAAVEATPRQWRDPAWIDATFSPLAGLLDKVVSPGWQLRQPVTPDGAASLEELDKGIATLLSATRRFWHRHARDPYFPVQAQPLLSGDESMDGAALLDLLRGLGAWQQQNATMFLSLVRAFLMACPAKLGHIRRPYQGLSEPLGQPLAWISHRTAFYDEIFFEHLRSVLRLPLAEDDRRAVLGMLQGLLRYIVVTSREELLAPGTGQPHPGITCLPMDARGQPLCRLSKKDWTTKQELGFGDYLPDMDTTFLALAMARQWLDLADTQEAAWELGADPVLLDACQDLLDHPWPEILAQYQHGSPTQVLGCTNAVTGPLDYHGAVGLWLERPFPGEDGEPPVAQALGNDMCLGHNMDVLESLLANRVQWRSLEGDNLETCRRLLEFHLRAYASGAFAQESAVRFYLPATYVHYTGRLWRTFQSMSRSEQQLLDPHGAVDVMRATALYWLREDYFAATCNAFDAAVGVLALVLLETDDTGLLAHGCRILLDAMGEAGPRQVYRGYEWTLVRHPTRIIVGSSESTVLFALAALAEARAYLDGKNGQTASPPMD